VDLPVGYEEDLAERIAGLGPLSQFTTKMNEPTKRMLEYFENKPPERNVHIIVEKPVIGTCFFGHLGSRTDGVVSWHAPILLLPLFRLFCSVAQALSNSKPRRKSWKSASTPYVLIYLDFAELVNIR